MANLYIGMGVPGSGKSTFLKQFNVEDKSAVISRDDIRYSLITDNDEYFSKETEVFDQFVYMICHMLNAGFDVYADATHLNLSSRFKLLRRIPRNYYENLYGYYFDVSIGKCLERNEKRKGTRAYVPRNIIRKMGNSFVMPDDTEGFAAIYIVNEKGEVVENVEYLDN